VAKRLTEAGYKVYCPLYKIKRQWSDRIKIIEEPLFRSYVFIQIQDYKRDEVFSHPGVIRYLFWLGKPAKVLDFEIKIIQKWLGHYDHECLQIEDISPGSLVRITAGQFMNEEAILLDQKRNKALVQLKEVGIQLSLDLQNNDLLRIS
jgi:transcription antitermination factor NusG